MSREMMQDMSTDTGRRVLSTAGAGLALLLAACGGSANGRPSSATAPAPGTFEWTVNGITLTATATMFNGILLAAYSVGATVDGKAFSFDVQGLTARGEMCALGGTFTAAVPPPAGTYPILTASQAAMDGWFFAGCASGTLASNARLVYATDGHVVLDKSEVGDVEGSFEMQAPPAASGGPATTITGRFNVGCVANQPKRCGPFTSPSGGTCADLSACCGADAACMVLRAGAMQNGDAACARTLMGLAWMYCP
ncbi:MAG TPA: hypothetical protein VGL59_12310 [Polyangia bacterium]